jgi:REP element-mobilizing transposase RayT
MSNPRHRRSIRLPGYDYTSAGAYFVTLLIHQRQHLFGTLANGEVQLTTWGRLAETEWRRLPERFHGLLIDTFVIMPDHLHAILWINTAAMLSSQEARHPTLLKMDGSSPASPQLGRPLPNPPPPGSLGAVIGAYKATTARLINGLRHSPGAPVWQRNYFERIIRDEDELSRIYEYIQSNPLNADDEKNPFR